MYVPTPLTHVDPVATRLEDVEDFLQILDDVVSCVYEE